MNESKAPERTLTRFVLITFLLVTIGLLSQSTLAGTGTFKNGKFNFCVSVRFMATEAQLDAIRIRFNRANQFLADATDGQHQFGTISIVNNSGASDEAEFWIFPQGGRAEAGRYGVRRSHVNMYFGSNFSKPDIDREGLTIVNEFAHHAYNVYDEYMRLSFNGTEPFARCPPISEDTNLNLSYCIMDDFNRGARRLSTTYSVTEFCIASNHDPDRDTAQHSMHGESCWETMSHLLRPWRLTLPNGLPQDSPPVAQPVTFTTSCSSQIQRTMLLIDRSGSMLDTSNRHDGSRLTIAQQSVSSFINAYNDGDASGIFVGLASFSTSARVDASIIEVNSAAARNSIKTAANSLVAAGSTNIGEGLLVAQEQLNAQGTCADCQKTVILISDGDHNVGVPPESVTHVTQREFGFST